jgi:hypothetical protein
MTVSEQIWFAVTLGGFLIFLEAGITLIAKLFARGRTKSDRQKMKEDIVEGRAKSIAGAVILAIGLIAMFNLPST